MNTNKNTIIIALIVLALIIGTGYKAVFGSEDSIPTLDELRLQARNDLMDQQQRIDTHNLMALSACIEEAKDKSEKASEQIKFQNDCFEKNKRRDIDIEKEMERFETSSGTVASANSGAPERTTQVLAEDRSLSLECELGVRERKVEGIEFHYTDTKGSTLAAIKRGHEGKFGIDHIGYHYVIKENGEITNTRDERCIAAADKWSSNNYRLIQIAFIGNDKPTKEQTNSMVELSKDIQKRYSLPMESVSAHREWGPKSDKESLTYWYGSKDNFISLLSGEKKKDVLLRNGEVLESVNYAWNKWKDMDFILTIEAESRWDMNAVGDNGDAFGYCQINKRFNAEMQNEYRGLKTYQEKIDYCYGQYKNWVDKGLIEKRLHGYNVRLKNKSKYSFQ